MNGYITTGSVNSVNNNFILINDSIDEGNIQEITEIRPLENISRETFNNHLHFFYYAAVNAWNQNSDRNNNGINYREIIQENNENNENNHSENNSEEESLIEQENENEQEQ